MMYKCLDCGHIFDEGEQLIHRDRHGFSDGHYDTHATCPMPGCGGDYKETLCCKVCEGEYLPDELYTGDICEDCLKQSINTETTFLYVMNNDFGREFYVEHWTGSQVKRASPFLIELVKSAFQIELRRDPEEILHVCKTFVCGNLGHYAEWLAWKNESHEVEEVP